MISHLSVDKVGAPIVSLGRKSAPRLSRVALPRHRLLVERFEGHHIALGAARPCWVANTATCDAVADVITVRRLSLGQQRQRLSLGQTAQRRRACRVWGEFLWVKATSEWHSAHPLREQSIAVEHDEDGCRRASRTEIISSLIADNC